MKKVAVILLSVLMLAGCQTGPVNLELPSLIGDNMLLQQKTDALIWGKANPGQRISVTPGWSSEFRTTTGKDGRWSVEVQTPEAGGPYSIKVEGKDTSIMINNVLVGEVWFCSGQSNMEMPLAGWPPVDTVMYSTREIASADIPEIRLFNVQRKISDVPSEGCTGKWEVCSPESVRQFSATAYFFGKKLYEELHIPVGLIESAWGGTPAESWISSAVLENAGEFVSDIEVLKESAPLLSEYQEWLNDHKKLEVKPGEDQWKNLNFDDGNVLSVDFDDSAWPVINLPGLFERVTGEFDGAIWFRKKIELPADFKGSDLVLSLGPIDDMDCTYFNGELVGSNELTGFYQVERNYDIPSSLVMSGLNTIAVRVMDNQGGGGIYGRPGSMKISVKNSRLAPVLIEGEWKYQPVAELSGNEFYILDVTKNEFNTRTRPKTPGPSAPTVLYNGMVSPVINYRIKGAIWYQGESNVGRAGQYEKIFPLMIQNWRDSWGIKDFPFYYVQIAPYFYSHVDSAESALLREAQAKALQLPNTGMAVTLDIATVMNIHPPFKKEVGERLADLALAKDYGKKIIYSGPLYRSMTIDGNVIKIQFDNIEEGLAAKDNKLTEFEIAGKDGRFVKAVARLVRDEVWVTAPKVREPVSARYCWRNGAVASLFNSAGLPASQFRTKE